MTKKNCIYLDYAATTPVDERVIQKMIECLSLQGTFGNPASNHYFGNEAREQIEKARAQVAGCIQAVPRNILFTSGATESNNLAIKGVAQFYRSKGNHIVTCKTEHKSILDPCTYLEAMGFSVTYLSVDKNGLIDLEELRSVLKKETILVSVMQINNETGVLQNIQPIAELTRERGVFLHVDAAQSFGKIDINVQQFPVDLMSFSGHKIYGPKGIGVLYINDSPRVRLTPLLHGGGQERKLRAGTLATHQIVGMGEASKIAQEIRQAEMDKIRVLRNRFWAGIQYLPNICINGHEGSSVPNILNVKFQGLKKETLLKKLGSVAISSASACNTTYIEPSYVLRAMGLSSQEAEQSIRFSFGRFSLESEIDHVVNLIREMYLEEGM